MTEANQEPPDKELLQKYRREEKTWSIIGAVIYSIFALFITYFFIAFSCMLFEIKTPKFLKAMLKLLLYYSVLIPVPLPVYFMFRNYLRKESKSTWPSLSVLILYYGVIVYFMVMVSVGG